MNMQEIIEKWLMVDRDTTPLWRLSIHEIDYDESNDPSDGVEIAALAENIRQCGLIHPVIVEHQKKGKKYRLVSGRRRIEAVRLLGHTHISALLVKGGSILPLSISLSENIMRKSLDIFELADKLYEITQQISVEDAAKLFSVKAEWINERIKLTELSVYEKQWIRFLQLDEPDAIQLCKIESGELRRRLLEKMLELSDPTDRKALIARMLQTHDLRALQSEKIYVQDIRIFLNSVERAAEMMRSAGYSTDINRSDGEEFYQFTIRVSKTKQSDTSARPHPQSSRNVSRETLPRFDKLSDRLSQDVSRETFKNPFLAIDERQES